MCRAVIDILIAYSFAGPPLCSRLTKPTRLRRGPRPSHMRGRGARADRDGCARRLAAGPPGNAHKPDARAARQRSNSPIMFVCRLIRLRAGLLSRPAAAPPWDPLATL